MKLLIKSLMLLMGVLVLVFFLWPGPILERIGTYLLNTPVKIDKAWYGRYKGFKLRGIGLHEKGVFFKSGAINIIPPALELSGLKLTDKIILDEKKFYAKIIRKKNWDVTILLRDVDLSKFEYGFEKGKADADIGGICKEGICDVYGILRLEKIVYSDSNSSFLGISSEEFQKLMEDNNGKIELDFTYKGPLDGLDSVSNYSPGRKTFQLVASIVMQKMFE